MPTLKSRQPGSGFSYDERVHRFYLLNPVHPELESIRQQSPQEEIALLLAFVALQAAYLLDFRIIHLRRNIERQLVHPLGSAADLSIRFQTVSDDYQLRKSVVLYEIRSEVVFTT